MEQKPGWTYRFISSLNMQIAINDTTGVMYTEDKVRYSVEEQRLLQSIDYALPLSVHLVKKVFDGTIVSIIIRFPDDTAERILIHCNVHIPNRCASVRRTISYMR